VNMSINQNISFGGSIKISKLKNVTVNKMITVNVSIKEPHIQKCSGSFVINQLFGTNRKRVSKNWAI
ncbi:putative LRR containing protein, partial [Trachipleistophora hominis]